MYSRTSSAASKSSSTASILEAELSTASARRAAWHRHDCKRMALAARTLLCLLLISHSGWGLKFADGIRVRGLGQSSGPQHHSQPFPPAHPPGVPIPRAAPQQWLADPDSGELMTILVPVYPDDYTLALLGNQLRTFAQYLEIDSILEILFVSPADQLEKLVTFLEEWLNKLPEIPGDKVKVVADEDCAPELSEEGLKALDARGWEYLAGWDKQQLIKFACAWVVKTPFYLILDADVLFLWPISVSNLVQASAHNASDDAPACLVCDRNQQTEYRALNEILPVDHDHTGWDEARIKQAQWSWKSAKTLGITELPDISHHQHLGVTPQTFATPIVLAMAEYIEDHLSQDHGLPNGKDNWRQYLLRAIFKILFSDQGPAWTEYETYWAFAHHKGYWDLYHAQGHLWRGPANVWDDAGFRDWDPCRKVQLPDYPPGYPGYPGRWAVVQSRLKIPADDIWAKLTVCFEAEKAAAATADQAQ